MHNWANSREIWPQKIGGVDSKFYGSIMGITTTTTYGACFIGFQEEDHSFRMVFLAICLCSGNASPHIIQDGAITSFWFDHWFNGCASMNL